MLLEIDLRDPNDPDDDFIPWRYTWGLDLAGQNGQVNSLEGAGTIGGLLAMQDMDDPNDPSDPNDATGRFACFYDGNGNLTQLLHLGTWDPNNPAVAIRAHYEYDPYGNVVRQTGDYAATNPWRFSTKQFDAETGLGYWGYRYYSPALGRWMSRDPIGEHGEVTLYVFVKNAPSMQIDADGRLTVQTQKILPRACGNHVVDFIFILDKPAPCDGFFVQRIEVRIEIRKCSKRDCPIRTSSLTPNPNGVYWEAFPVTKGSNTTLTVSETGRTDVRVLTGKHRNTCGNYSSLGEVRFYCQSVTGPLGSPGSGFKFNEVREAARAAATYEEPSWWKDTPTEGPAFADVSSYWNCCPCAGRTVNDLHVFPRLKSGN